MKKILVLSFATLHLLTAQTNNPEYQKMLATRADILGIQKTQSPQETSGSLPALTQEEETVNNQFTDLLQQLNNLDTTN